MHRTGVYSAMVGLKGPALERFLDIKKKLQKKKKRFILGHNSWFTSMWDHKMLLKIFHVSHNCNHSWTPINKKWKQLLMYVIFSEFFLPLLSALISIPCPNLIILMISFWFYKYNHKLLLLQADVDGNGTIDYIEFITATMHMNRVDREDHLYKAFVHFDKDKSG